MNASYVVLQLIGSANATYFSLCLFRFIWQQDVADGDHDAWTFGENNEYLQKKMRCQTERSVDVQLLNVSYPFARSFSPEYEDSISVIRTGVSQQEIFAVFRAALIATVLFGDFNSRKAREMRRRYAEATSRSLHKSR